MRVIVNGFEEDVRPGANVADLIEAFGEQDEVLIVEVNGRFVHPRDYKGFEVRVGDKVELINPAFGG